MNKERSLDELWKTWDRLETGLGELQENLNYRLLCSALQENGNGDLLWIDSIAVLELGLYHVKKETVGSRLRRALHGLHNKLKKRMGKSLR